MGSWSFISDCDQHRYLLIFKLLRIVDHKNKMIDHKFSQEHFMQCIVSNEYQIELKSIQSASKLASSFYFHRFLSNSKRSKHTLWEVSHTVLITGMGLWWWSLQYLKLWSIRCIFWSNIFVSAAEFGLWATKLSCRVPRWQTLSRDLHVKRTSLVYYC